MIKRLRTVYPSLTHPVHASLITGCSPGKTGIVDNSVSIPGKINTPWYNRLNQIQQPTLFHMARQANLTTCACRWPVTSWSENEIDYLIPAIMKDDANIDSLLSVYQKMGASSIMEEIVKPNFWRLKGQERPYYDNFTVACACDIIRHYQPNLLFTNLGMVDEARHQNGVFHPNVDLALKRVDAWVGQILDAIEMSGLEKATDIVVLSDHGQINIQRTICLNVLLVEEGIIRLDSEGNVYEWDAWIKSCGTSAQVYLRDKSDTAFCTKLQQLLNMWCQKQVYGISELLDSDECSLRYGLHGDFSFVLETDGYTSFSDEWLLPLVRNSDCSDFRTSRATHGHMPHKGPQPTLIAKGPNFQQNVVIEEESILNVAPTLAALFNWSFPDADGMPIRALLSKE